MPYYNISGDTCPPDTEKNTYVRLMQRIVDNITAMGLELLFWILTLDYVHTFIIPCIFTGNTRKSNILSFQFATTH